MSPPKENEKERKRKSSDSLLSACTINGHVRIQESRARASCKILKINKKVIHFQLFLDGMRSTAAYINIH